ncbi:MAG: hypothetical protein J6Q94_01935 [Clostridia bacterium]|nr:hypothetical protein [Clostridia bacterium]
MFYFLSSNQIHEYLKVNKPFENSEITKLIQFYLLDCIKRKAIYDAAGEEYVLELKIVINDSEICDSSDLAELRNAVLKLETAEKYVIDMNKDGSTGDIVADISDEIEIAMSNDVTFYCGMLSILQKSEEKNFVYKNMIYHRSSGEYSFAKINEDGQYKLFENAEVIDNSFAYKDFLMGEDLHMSIDFDTEGYPYHADKIKAVIEKHIADDYQLSFCREQWEEEGHLGLGYIQWYTPLDKVYDFIDEINSVLDELPTECFLDASGVFVDFETFTLAFFDVVDSRYVVRGIQY